jgi:competence protein ComFC
LVVATSYKNPAIKNLIHNFKYKFIPEISAPLAKLMVKALIKSDASVPDLIVPVPLHSRRLRWRGFNQSKLLAERISEDLTPLMKIKVLDVLERKRFTKPQMKISNYRERLENVEDVFILSDKFQLSDIENKNILLVDDISTTGATLQQCAKILKNNGVKKVFTSVIAN